LIKSLFQGVIIHKKVDRRQLLKAMIDHPKGYQKLIKWLFPVVKTFIYQELTKTKTKVVVMEVPLLFQGNLDAYCDVIIGVEMDSSTQRLRLQNRVGDHAESLWILSERNHYHDFKSFIDLRLKNDGSLKTWQQQAKKVLSPYKKYL
jgi:dephospho-CoA kinase